MMMILLILIILIDRSTCINCSKRDVNKILHFLGFNKTHPSIVLIIIIIIKANNRNVLLF